MTVPTGEISSEIHNVSTISLPRTYLMLAPSEIYFGVKSPANMQIGRLVCCLSKLSLCMPLREEKLKFAFLYASAISVEQCSNHAFLFLYAA